jgi:hypothetical protein
VEDVFFYIDSQTSKVEGSIFLYNNFSASEGLLFGGGQKSMTKVARGIHSNETRETPFYLTILAYELLPRRLHRLKAHGFDEVLQS